MTLTLKKPTPAEETFRLAFFIPGVAAPMGSKIRTRFGMRESSQRVKPWQKDVIAATEGAVDEHALFEAIGKPTRVDTFFYFRRPKTTKFEFPVQQSVGDGDKLTRSTWDGLVKGGLLLDDKLVVRWSGSKDWAAADEQPGCLVRVWEIN